MYVCVCVVQKRTCFRTLGRRTIDTHVAERNVERADGGRAGVAERGAGATRRRRAAARDASAAAARRRRDDSGLAAARRALGRRPVQQVPAQRLAVAVARRWRQVDTARRCCL
jgi:hypothetical protein